MIIGTTKKLVILVVLYALFSNVSLAGKFKKWECEGIAQGAASYYNTLVGKGEAQLNAKVDYDEKRFPEARELQQAAKSFAKLIHMALQEEQPGARFSTKQVIETTRSVCVKWDY